MSDNFLCAIHYFNSLRHSNWFRNTPSYLWERHPEMFQCTRNHNNENMQAFLSRVDFKLTSKSTHFFFISVHQVLAIVRHKIISVPCMQGYTTVVALKWLHLGLLLLTTTRPFLCSLQCQGHSFCDFYL